MIINECKVYLLIVYCGFFYLQNYRNVCQVVLYALCIDVFIDERINASFKSTKIKHNHAKKISKAIYNKKGGFIILNILDKI